MFSRYLISYFRKRHQEKMAEAQAGLWSHYIFPWQENTPWLFLEGSGDLDGDGVA